MSTPASNTVVTPSTAPEVLPAAQTLVQASKIAIEQDRAIMLDYYRQTCAGTAFLGEDHRAFMTTLSPTGVPYIFPEPDCFGNGTYGKVFGCWPALKPLLPSGFNTFHGSLLQHEFADHYAPWGRTSPRKNSGLGGEPG